MQTKVIVNGEVYVACKECGWYHRKGNLRKYSCRSCIVKSLNMLIQ